MKSYQEFIERKKREHGKKFSEKNINRDFIKYYENGARVEVGYYFKEGAEVEIKRGTIGITTGWQPCFLLMLTKRSIGSSYIINENCKILKVIK
jgi:hypothetical protein